VECQGQISTIMLIRIRIIVASRGEYHNNVDQNVSIMCGPRVISAVIIVVTIPNSGVRVTIPQYHLQNVSTSSAIFHSTFAIMQRTPAFEKHKYKHSVMERTTKWWGEGR
jgi:hypothetical protein